MPASKPLRLALCQIAPCFGDIDENTRRIAQLTRELTADLLVLPELALTGYDVRDRVHELGISADELPERFSLPQSSAVATGFIERADNGITYNASAIVQERAVVALHRKIHLPTYGMFDEGRYFGRGDRVVCGLFAGWRFGVLICEDFWHPSLTYLLSCQQMDVLLVQAAAPGRGAWTGDRLQPFASTAIWERLARTTAQLYGIYVVLCNRVGVEGGVTFAGGSLVVDPSGQVLTAAPGYQEAVLDAILDPEELYRAQRPYMHSRDEEPQFVVRELQRILAAHAG
ncbi:MAG: nitrilase-related carbon-nitrogen hydrolase [Longimicrobiales bacterium]